MLRTNPGSSLGMSTSRPPKGLLLLLNLCLTCCLGLCLCLLSLSLCLRLLLSRLGDTNPNTSTSKHDGVGRCHVSLLYLKHCTPLGWHQVGSNSQSTEVTTPLCCLCSYCHCFFYLSLSIIGLPLLGHNLLAFALLCSCQAAGRIISPIAS